MDVRLEGFPDTAFVYSLSDTKADNFQSLIMAAQLAGRSVTIGGWGTGVCGGIVAGVKVLIVEVGM